MGSLHAEAALTAQTSGPGEGAPPRRVTGLVQPQPSSFRHNLFLIFSYKKLSENTFAFPHTPTGTGQTERPE